LALKTCLMIGGGGMAGGWIRWWTTQFQDRIKIIGLVDVNLDVLQKQKEALGLSDDQLFTDASEALATVRADFCGVATPPQFHKDGVIGALRAGMPVICEKPIAGSLPDALEMVAVAKETGLPCSIIQNYRYEPNKQELIRIRDEGRLGRLQHVIGRYACDYRGYGTWGTWRHDLEHGLLVEGSVHHFDMLRFLTGGNCEQIVGMGWNPEWSSFKHESSGFYLLKMDNGVHAFYEANSSAAGITNCWHKEYYRAEFEEGSVEVAEDDSVRITRGSEVEEYRAPPMDWTNHTYLFDEFLNWLDGGPPSQTRIEENLPSFAMVIAAMETSRDNQPKRIADFLN